MVHWQTLFPCWFKYILFRCKAHRKGSGAAESVTLASFLVPALSPGTGNAIYTATALQLSVSPATPSIAPAPFWLHLPSTCWSLSAPAWHHSKGAELACLCFSARCVCNHRGGGHSFCRVSRVLVRSHLGRCVVIN